MYWFFFFFLVENTKYFNTHIERGEGLKEIDISIYPKGLSDVVIWSYYICLQI